MMTFLGTLVIKRYLQTDDLMTTSWTRHAPVKMQVHHTDATPIKSSNVTS